MLRACHCDNEEYWSLLLLLSNLQLLGCKVAHGVANLLLVCIEYQNDS